jgi:hypothetical protein
MHIEHVAIWTSDIERLKTFYVTYFGAQAGEKYARPAQQCESCDAQKFILNENISKSMDMPLTSCILALPLV